MTERETVIHAYGVVYPNSPLDVPEVGIDGALVGLEQDDTLAVLVSELPADRFGPEQWQRHSDDPRWLGEVAQQHHQVLQQVMEQVDVLPLRLPGIHADLDSLQAGLHTETATLTRALARVKGRMELGVKAYAVDQQPSPDQAKPQSGRDYLLRRTAQGKERDDARQRRHDAVVAVHDRLSDEAVDAVTNPPQDPVLSGRTEPMLLNAAYLVGRDDEDAFLARVEELRNEYADAGLQIETSGPWPPYNFADVTVPEREETTR